MHCSTDARSRFVIFEFEYFKDINCYFYFENLTSTFSFAARVVQYNYNHSRLTIISTTIIPNTSFKMMYSTIAVSRPIDDRLYECGDKCIVRGAWIE
ncbi:hypothetical protein T12_13240 [Trichinella patagoniensis]|uniref:Uncharacterized protein n=1 Tax=Trichinella patagoniensis TaxID=990121 RepID=A0A0V0ZZL9_9BILA|nr:hypothetical protein T12_13240 [Trichinella patagoniensis]